MTYQPSGGSGRDGRRGTVNAGSGHSRSIQEVYALLLEISGLHKPLVQTGEKRRGEIMDVVADISRARGCSAGYQPPTGRMGSGRHSRPWPTHEHSMSLALSAAQSGPPTDQFGSTGYGRQVWLGLALPRPRVRESAIRNGDPEHRERPIISFFARGL